MNELQDADDGITFVEDETEAQAAEVETKETPESKDAELAPADPEEGKENTETPDTDLSDNAKKAINKQHWKYQEEKRAREAAEQRERELQEKLKQFDDKDVEIEVPALPEDWDEDRDLKLAERDKAIAHNAQVAARKQIVADEQRRNELRAQEEAQKKLDTQLMEYGEKGRQLGVKDEDLVRDLESLVKLGVPVDLEQELLSNPDGPLISRYLMTNLSAFDELASMSTADKIRHIDNVIGPKIAELKPKPTQTPDPVTTPEGSSPAVKQLGPEGATFI